MGMGEQREVDVLQNLHLGRSELVGATIRPYGIRCKMPEYFAVL